MDTAEWIERAQRGDKEAREQLILNNMALVWSIVKRFANRGYEAQDLFQIGSIGLMKAIDKFDTAYEVKFSTYAVPMIAGEIKRFLRDDGMVKVSRSLKENGWKIKQAAEKLGHELGRDATLNELVEETGLSMETIVVSMEANLEVESIYQSVYQSDGNEIYLVDQVASNERGADKVLDHMLLKQLLEVLNEKEKELIELRYFKDKTQTEVAKQLGISQVQVSRMEKKILRRMRDMAG